MFDECCHHLFSIFILSLSFYLEVHYAFPGVRSNCFHFGLRISKTAFPKRPVSRSSLIATNYFLFKACRGLGLGKRLGLED